MILRLIMEKEDSFGRIITYRYNDAITDRAYAIALYNYGKTVTLQVNEQEYVFSETPKFVIKSQLNIKYPLSNKWKKTIGFPILQKGECVANYYGEAATCRKRGIFKKNIGFTVFEYNNEPYMVYRVGFSKQNSHYYCIHNNAGETVAIIERHSFYKNNCKATIYIEKETDILIALLVCTEGMISSTTYGSINGETDLSAGHYISLLEEEKAMFDKEFYERVKSLL